MTKGPRPPHERPWRHPSELPGPPPEPMPSNGRLWILAAASAGLVVVGVLGVALIPGRDHGVETLSPASISVSSLAAGTDDGDQPAGAVPARSAARTAADLAHGPVAPDDAAPLLATPIGDGLAVTTRSALGHGAAGADGGVGGAGGAAPVPLAATLPSGDAVTAELLATSGDIAYLRILATPDGEEIIDESASEENVVDEDVAGTEVIDEDFVDEDAVETESTERVVGSLVDVVYVLADDGEFAAIERTAIAEGAVGEATPVYDDDGTLLGLCTNGPDGMVIVALVEPPPAGVTPPSTAAPPEPSAPAATEPAPASEPEPSEPTGPPEPTTPDAEPPPTTPTTDPTAPDD